MGGQATDSTGCKAGQYPGGRGGGSKRRPSGNGRDKATTGGGEPPPERGRTSHRSSRKRKKKGNGTHGPHGRVASGPERPWRSAPGPSLMGPQWNGESKACACIFRAASSLQVNRLERHAGKLARAVLRGRGPGDRLLLPDRPLVPRSRFRQQVSASVRLLMSSITVVILST